MAQNPESGSPPAFPKLLALPAVERPVRLPVMDILGRDLEGQSNLRVFPHRKDNTAGGNFPDGRALGTPAAAMPVRETDAEGVAAWTLRRSHYLYVAHLHLRETARLVSRLAGAGFIAKASEAREGYPHAPKFGAALLPFDYEYAAKNAYWFDRDRRRRMVYPVFADADDRNALGSQRGEVWICALIRDAQKKSEQLKTDTAHAFVEGFAAGMGGSAPERLH